MLLSARRNFTGTKNVSRGKPYVSHPIAVATYLAHLEASGTTLIAALLHDVVEDSHSTPRTSIVNLGMKSHTWSTE